MSKKPDGESRIPTNFWSGMGFSKSMPDHVIRDRLRSAGVQYTEPSMATTYEVTHLYTIFSYIMNVLLHRTQKDGSIN